MKNLLILLAFSIEHTTQLNFGVTENLFNNGYVLYFITMDTHFINECHRS